MREKAGPLSGWLGVLSTEAGGEGDLEGDFGFCDFWGFLALETWLLSFPGEGRARSSVLASWFDLSREECRTFLAGAASEVGAGLLVVLVLSGTCGRRWVPVIRRLVRVVVGGALLFPSSLVMGSSVAGGGLSFSIDSGASFTERLRARWKEALLRSFLGS